MWKHKLMLLRVFKTTEISKNRSEDKCKKKPLIYNNHSPRKHSMEGNLQCCKMFGLDPNNICS